MKFHKKIALTALFTALAAASLVAQAQTNRIANQGESLAEVQPYLTQAGLPLKNVLLDGGSQLSAALTARALPTTAFYDAQGRLVEVYMGELTSAAIARRALPLVRRRSSSAAS